ncbi:hypothetical protein M5689_006714 [Euphorbia peplus]|nr:hypothetical protein M5689_006714 [Euphorbia peplus]
MVATTSSTSLCNIPQYQKCPFSVPNPSFRLRNSQFLQISKPSSCLELHHQNNIKVARYMAVFAGVDPGPIVPSDPSSLPWKMWIVGMLITAILPFWKNKFWPLIKLKEKVESIVETTEEVAEAIEKVAERIEKVAEEVADHLPEGGHLHKAAIFLEHAAKETAQDAHLVDQFIDKVQEVEEDAESLIQLAMDEAKDIRKETK